VKTAASGFRFTEGPVWHPDGFIIFSDIPANTIYRLNKNGKKAVYRRPSGKSNGLAFDAEGRLLACEHGNRRVSITRNGEPETLVASYKGQRLNSPNDLVIRSDGSIYFTDPPYGVPSKKRELDFQGVYRIGPDGEQLTLLLKDFERPNGIALSPDEETLYVADTQKNWVRAFDVQEDGSVTNGRVFARAGNLHPDGMAMDVEGNLYVTGGGGVWVFSPDGSRVGIIETERMPANVAFGGPEGRTLYITARSDLYTVPVKYRGASLDYRIEHAD
jgi:gluconolactonase